MGLTMRRFLGMVIGVGFLALAMRAGTQEPVGVKPTIEHIRLARAVGTWDATMKTYVQGPDAEPIVSQGTEVVKLMPGGLWLQTEYDGKIGEIPFHAVSLTGYDPKKDKYVGTWVDSMSPTLLVTEGDFDTKTKSLTMNAKGTEQLTGKPYEAKMTSIFSDKETRLYMMFVKNDRTKGQFVKFVEITYTKRPD